MLSSVRLVFEHALVSPTSQRIGRALLIGTAGCLCLAAAAAIVVFLTLEVDSQETTGKIGFTACFALLFGVASAAGVSVLVRTRGRWLGSACIAASIAGFVVATVMVWTTWDDAEPPEGLLKATAVLFIVAFTLAQVSLLAIPPAERSPRVAPVVRGAQAAVTILAALLIVAVLLEVSDGTYYRWVGAASVLWLLGLALLPLMRRLAGPPSGRRPAPAGGPLPEAAPERPPA